MLYAQLSKNYEHGGDGYICREARNLAEAKALIEDGFEFVMDKGGASLFRKLNNISEQSVYNAANPA